VLLFPVLQELDGVNWEWVATEMGTRNYKQCLQKWYDEVRS
jgi:hypothetical protein